MTALTAEEQAACDQYELMPPDTGVQLSYIIARLLTRFTEYRGLSDETIMEARGAMTGALIEYNRSVGPEHTKDIWMDRHGELWGSLA